MGSIVLTAPDSFGPMKGATLNLGAINSVDSSVGAVAGTRSSFYAGLTLPTPSSKVKFGAAFDYLNLNTGGGNNDDIWVAGLYSTISPTDKLSFNFRGEIMDATQVNAHYGEEVTATVQYQLWANVLSRVEFRWDHYGVDAFGYSQGKAATGNLMKENDFMLALNLIYQF
jgi:hypothetical protein